MSANRKRMSRGASIGVITGGVLAGAALVGAGVANAATSTPSTPSTPSTTSIASSPGQAPQGFNHGGAIPIRSDEKSVSPSVAATLKAAALKAVPGATVYRVETDAGDATYEVHLTKTDGSLATVKFDKNLAVAKVETGMGQGDPAPQSSTGSGNTGA